MTTLETHTKHTHGATRLKLRHDTTTIRILQFNTSKVTTFNTDGYKKSSRDHILTSDSRDPARRRDVRRLAAASFEC